MCIKIYIQEHCCDPSSTKWSRGHIVPDGREPWPQSHSGVSQHIVSSDKARRPFTKLGRILCSAHAVYSLHTRRCSDIRAAEKRVSFCAIVARSTKGDALHAATTESEQEVISEPQISDSTSSIFVIAEVECEA